MAKIQTNSSGTRSIEVTDEHLQTIDDYQLLRDLIDSTGYVDEDVLCLDVVYHPNMKAYGLQQLVMLYINWKNRGNDNLGTTVRAFQGTPFN